MESSPWKTLSTQKIYDNAWITLHEDQVITPRNTEGIYGRVCFKNKAIGIIPIDEKGNTWLVGQYRYTLSEYSWEIPMGGGHPDETPLEGAQRELREETGITAKSWEQIALTHTSNSVTDETGYVFLAKQLSFADTEPDDTEDLKIWKLPAAEAIQMVKEGKITDAISMIGLLRLEDYL